MEPIRTYVDVRGDTITVPVPEEYRNHRVKVTVEPVTESGEEENGIPIPKSGVQILSQPKGPVDYRKYRGVLKGRQTNEEIDAQLNALRNEWERDF